MVDALKMCAALRHENRNGMTPWKKKSATINWNRRFDESVTQYSIPFYWPSTRQASQFLKDFSWLFSFKITRKRVRNCIALIDSKISNSVVSRVVKLTFRMLVMVLQCGHVTKGFKMSVPISRGLAHSLDVQRNLRESVGILLSSGQFSMQGRHWQSNQ